MSYGSGSFKDGQGGYGPGGGGYGPGGPGQGGYGPGGPDQGGYGPGGPGQGGYGPGGYGPGGPVPGQRPGRTLGIVALVLSIIPCTNLIGLILGIVARSQSKRAGLPNPMAMVAIVLGAISLVLGLLFFAGGGVGVYKVYQKCQELGPGTHTEGNATYSCG